MQRTLTNFLHVCVCSEGAEFQNKEYDVLLHSEANDLVLGRKHLVPAWAFCSDHDVELIETAGWYINGTNTPSSKPDMIRGPCPS